MSWRTVVVTGCVKLSCKNRHLVVRGEKLTTIHLSEIAEIIVESTMATLTSHLVAELAAAKIKLVFCDDRHNPVCEAVPYYGAHNTAKKVLFQSRWSEAAKADLWAEIVRRKILNQAVLLDKNGLAGGELLRSYASEVSPADGTNREGHAAKVYFNALFSKAFTREVVSDENAALNYGYSVLLSAVNRAVVAKGYVTQLGIWHRSEFNEFNLSCDLMEPLRVLVDEAVYRNRGRALSDEYKHELVGVLNRQVAYRGVNYYLTNFLGGYVSNVLETLDAGESRCPLYEYA